VELLNIAVDPPQAWRSERLIARHHDPDAVGRGQPRGDGLRSDAVEDADGRAGSHLRLDRPRRLAWIRDYGALEHGGLMYVPAVDLVPQIAGHLEPR